MADSVNDEFFGLRVYETKKESTNNSMGSSTPNVPEIKHMPFLQTPVKIESSESYLLPKDVEMPTSAIKNEVAKFCDEINESKFDYTDDITIEESKLYIQEGDENLTSETSNKCSDPKNTTSQVVNENITKEPSNETYSNLKTVIASSFRSYKPSEKKNKPYECGHCGKCFANKEKLTKHISSHAEFMPYRCEQCNKGFFQKSNFTFHKRTPCRNGPFKCEKCGHEFQQKRYLTKHFKNMHDKKDYKYKCSECDFRAISLFYLKRHAYKHWKDKPYKCEKCPYQSHHKMNFIRHGAVHTSERPYSCPVCNATFKTDKTLESHQKTHEKSHYAKHHCQYCEMSFLERRNLLKHVKALHETQNSLYCDMCQENLIDKGAFNAHKKVKRYVDPNLKCERENCTFQAKTDCQFNAHMLHHDSVKIQKCPICRRIFRNMKELKIHLLKHANLIKCKDCGGNFNHRSKINVEVKVLNPVNENTNPQLQDKNESDEPYVILEVLKYETDNGENRVQYNLKKSLEDQDRYNFSEQPKRVVKSNVSVKCHNKIHNYMDILKRFQNFLKNNKQEPGL